MFKPKKIETFDDVASDAAKDARAAIYAKALEQILYAADLAARGNVKTAQDAQQRYWDLRSLAVSIPLDIIRAERAAAKKAA